MRHIRHCTNTKLIALCERTIQLEALNTKLTTLLPEPLQPHCQVASFNKGCLLLITDNAVWASQLRYLLPEIRDTLRCGGLYQLVSVKLSVAVNARQVVEKPKAQHKLSEKSRDTIATASAQCRYPPLQAALLKLSEHIYSQQLDFQQGAHERGEGVYMEYMTEAERMRNTAENPIAKSISDHAPAGKRSIGINASGVPSSK